MKRPAASGLLLGEGKTTRVIRRASVVDGIDKHHGADQRGIARRECFT